MSSRYEVFLVENILLLMEDFPYESKLVESQSEPILRGLSKTVIVLVLNSLKIYTFEGSDTHQSIF